MKRMCAMAVAAGLLAMAGCVGPDTSGMSTERGRLQVENRALSSRVELVQDQTVFTDNGFLKVQVTVRNMSKRDTRVQYRFIWKDRNGMTLKNADMPWRTLTLYGREETVIEGVCPVSKAADFRLVVRPSETH